MFVRDDGTSAIGGDITTKTSVKMPRTPKRWMNAAMRGALRTPGLRRYLGRMFGILTVQGSKTGRRYPVTVQYFAHEGHFLVLSQRMRRWWRNLASSPHVEFLVKGRAIRARARIADKDEARSAVAAWFEHDPRMAKFYGISVDDPGRVDPSGIDEVLDRAVLIIIGEEV